MVPQFEVLPVDPDTDVDGFLNIWDHLVQEDDLTKAAYKAQPAAEKVIVYYSTAFGPYRDQVERLKREPALAARFSQNYEIWVGFHAIMQWRERSTAPRFDNLDDTDMEKLLDHERAIFAAMQVKQASEMARLQAQAARQPGSE